MVEVLNQTFDTTTFASISGTAGKYLNIVGIYIVNNSTDPATNETPTFVFDDDFVVLYGDSTAGLFLRGDGGDWGLPMTDDIDEPYFKSLATGAGFIITSSTGARISGSIWYYLSDT